MMKTNRHYQTPMVLKEVSVLLERDFLGGSIVDDSLEIISAGQEVTEIDAEGTDFEWNSTWEWE